MRRVIALLGCIGVLGVGAIGCGGDASDAAPGVVVEDALAHIHGLGEVDGRLYVATHDGLFAAGAGQTSVRRVGDDRKDLMGFAVAGDGRFVASGHPDRRDGLPPLVGVIDSVDRGRSWRPVALTGEADLHVLRVAGGRVYAVDSAQSRVLVSDDGGRRWTSRGPAPPTLDLAVDPQDPDHVVAAGEAGLLESDTAARRWRRLADTPTGLLAWPRGGGLTLIDGGGDVHAADAGLRRWRRVGSLGGQPVATAVTGAAILAATADNRVLRSTDAGRTWAVRAAP